MSHAVAKQGDHVVAVDTHLVIPASGGSPIAAQLPFDAQLADALSPNVLSEHRPVALVGSVARQSVEHIAPAGAFVRSPTNRARVVVGSPTVLANHRPIARAGDLAETCNDPEDLPVGRIVAAGTVLSG